MYMYTSPVCCLMLPDYHPDQVNFAYAVWSPEQTLLKVSIYNSKSSLLGKGHKVTCYLVITPA